MILAALPLFLTWAQIALAADPIGTVTSSDGDVVAPVADMVDSVTSPTPLSVVPERSPATAAPGAGAPAPEPDAAPPAIAPPTIQSPPPTIQPVISAAESVTPIVESVTPVVESVTPVVESVAPVVESVTPIVETITPVLETVSPIVDSVTPIVEAASPIIEPMGPVVEGLAPVRPDPGRAPPRAETAVSEATRTPVDAISATGRAGPTVTSSSWAPLAISLRTAVPSTPAVPATAMNSGIGQLTQLLIAARDVATDALSTSLVHVFVGLAGLLATMALVPPRYARGRLVAAALWRPQQFVSPLQPPG